MLIDREFERHHNINQLIQRIHKGRGLFTKWHSKHKRTFFDRSIDFGTLNVRVEKLSALFVFVLLAGFGYIVIYC